jgi:hypothetical protein
VWPAVGSRGHLVQRLLLHGVHASLYGVVHTQEEELAPDAVGQVRLWNKGAHCAGVQWQALRNLFLW